MISGCKMTVAGNGPFVNGPLVQLGFPEFLAVKLPDSSRLRRICLPMCTEIMSLDEGFPLSCDLQFLEPW